MKIKNVKFLKSASKAGDFPDYPYPEFAFFGRSNVGKSSLINMIVGRKSIVKVGSKPGVTKLVNFFIINDSISLADMPGYGYAKLPANIRKNFQSLIKSYIKTRSNLKLTFLLIDIRRVPGEMEKNIIVDITKRGLPIAIIATKCDKLSKNERNKNVKKIVSELMIDTDSVFFTSSKTREGRSDILRLIEEYSDSDETINS